MSEFLSFDLANELYAIPVAKVREILGGAPRLTRIPNAPPCLKGLIGLRGSIIPIVDVREAFGLPALSYGKLTVVIIAEVSGRPSGSSSTAWWTSWPSGRATSSPRPRTSACR